MSLSKKIWSLLVGGLFVLVLLGLVIIKLMDFQWGLLSKFYNRNHFHSMVAYKLALDIDKARGDLYKAMGLASASSEVTSDVESLIGKSIKNLEKAQSLLIKASKINVSSAEKKFYAQIRRLLIDYTSSVKQALDIGLADPSTAIIYFNSADDVYAKLNSVVHEFVDYENWVSKKSFARYRSLTYKIRYSLLIFMTLLVVLFVGISFLITRSITSRLFSVIDFVGKVTEGDFSGNINIDGSDELAQLAESMNKFTEKMRKILATIKEGSDETDLAAEELSDVSSNLAKSAGNIFDSVKTLSASMGELERAISDISHNSVEVAQSSQITKGEVEKGKQLLSKSVDSVEELSSTVKRTAETVEELNRLSDEIEKILKVIEDIAEQTNLLALNAAIEAARAGEHGRGFAVVADEVRKLAETTSKSTGEIGEIINRIKEQTVKILNLMNQEVEQSQENVEAIREVSAVFDKVKGAMEDLAERINQIAAAVEEQSASVKAISENVNLVEKEVSENKDLADKTKEASGVLKRLASELKSVVGMFRV